MTYEQERDYLADHLDAQTAVMPLREIWKAGADWGSSRRITYYTEMLSELKTILRLLEAIEKEKGYVTRVTQDYLKSLIKKASNGL